MEGLTWVLITIACYGHTNAQCVPLVENFKTRQECADKLVYYEEFDPLFGESYQIEVVKKNALCMPTVGEAFSVNG